MRPSEVEEHLPILKDGQFPPDVDSEADRRRFRLAVGIARELMGKIESPTVWSMARSIYRNPDFTD
jgi:hypothetical protein